MALVTMKEILDEAVKGRYAVGAFTGGNLVTAEAVLTVNKELRTPVIFLMHPMYLKMIGTDVALYFRLLKEMIRSVDIPATIILDHGRDFKDCMECIHYGIPSVMFDGSKLSNEDNIAATTEIVKAAHACGVTVEAEIGHVGGNEGTTDEGVAKSEYYTKPEDAEEFAARTGIDALAVSIGTVHGIYQGTPRLDIPRLDEIRARVGGLPLVMHGGSGLPDEEFTKAVDHGINKINFVTGLMVTAAGDVEAAKQAKARKTKKPFTYYDISSAVMDSMMNTVRHQVEVFRTRPWA